MEAIDSTGIAANVAGSPLQSPSMPAPDFPDLLGRHMRRIRASAAGVASEIGISREAVNNWRQGYSLPNRKHRDKLLACAKLEPDARRLAERKKRTTGAPVTVVESRRA